MCFRSTSRQFVRITPDRTTTSLKKATGSSRKSKTIVTFSTEVPPCLDVGWGILYFCRTSASFHFFFLPSGEGFQIRDWAMLCKCPQLPWPSDLSWIGSQCAEGYHQRGGGAAVCGYFCLRQAEHRNSRNLRESPRNVVEGKKIKDRKREGYNFDRILVRPEINCKGE